MGCHPLSFVFPEETDGVVTAFRLIFSSFLFCESFSVIAGGSWPKVFILHFCLWSHFLGALDFSSGFYMSVFFII